MIQNLVKIELTNTSKGNIASVNRYKSIVLTYPCKNNSICAPYKLTAKPGVYKIECWGSKGRGTNPGLGAYTKGILFLTKQTSFYVFVGASGFYNSLRNAVYKISGLSGGGATDVRLNKTEEWYDIESLISRIMVAAGGGGAEWSTSFAGMGGTLKGGDAYSTVGFECKGPTQTSGTECPDASSLTFRSAKSYKGTFGSAGFVEETADYGGFGGGGYYGGSSYETTYAGSGGSSFISGHEGCNAVRSSSTINHTDSPFHYSGFVFSDTQMIGGNETMPLPNGSRGIWNENNGAFKITLIRLYAVTCKIVYHCHQTFIGLMIASLYS